MPLTNPNDIEISMLGTAGSPTNKKIKIWSGAIVPAVAMGQVIDYTSAGFAGITNVSVIAQRDTTDPMLTPNVAIKGTPGLNSCTVNITQGNNATVTILGINVLSGGPIIAATGLSSTTLYCRVEGF